MHIYIQCSTGIIHPLFYVDPDQPPVTYTQCQKDRWTAQRNNEDYVPQCTEAGAYEPTQRYPDGSISCVDFNGEQVISGQSECKRLNLNSACRYSIDQYILSLDQEESVSKCTNLLESLDLLCNSTFQCLAILIYQTLLSCKAWYKKLFEIQTTHPVDC